MRIDHAVEYCRVAFERERSGFDVSAGAVVLDHGPLNRALDNEAAVERQECLTTT
jgi:hypothetical protein